MTMLRIRVRGRVQGVGYRAALQDEARRLRIAGWVRNRRDGSVEALLQGDPKALEALIAWARQGPRASGVEQLTVLPAEEKDKAACAGFDIHPSE